MAILRPIHHQELILQVIADLKHSIASKHKTTSPNYIPEATGSEGELAVDASTAATLFVTAARTPAVADDVPASLWSTALAVATLPAAAPTSLNRLRVTRTTARKHSNVVY